MDISNIIGICISCLPFTSLLVYSILLHLPNTEKLYLDISPIETVWYFGVVLPEIIIGIGVLIPVFQKACPNGAYFDATHFFNGTLLYAKKYQNAFLNGYSCLESRYNLY